jgi:hypothetical protein
MRSYLYVYIVSRQIKLRPLITWYISRNARCNVYEANVRANAVGNKPKCGFVYYNIYPLGDLGGSASYNGRLIYGCICDKPPKWSPQLNNNRFVIEI